MKPIVIEMLEVLLSKHEKVMCRHIPLLGVSDAAITHTTLAPAAPPSNVLYSQLEKGYFIFVHISGQAEQDRRRRFSVEELCTMTLVKEDTHWRLKYE